MSPEWVKVSGPVSVLRNTKNLLTESIALNELSEKEDETIVEVPLLLSPPSLRLLEGESRKIKVSIKLKTEYTPDNPAQ